MANGFWRNQDADNDGNNANNWYDAETGGSPLGRVPTSGDNACFSDTASSDNCTLSGAFDPDNIYFLSADTGGTDNYTGSFNAADQNLTISGAISIAPSSTFDFGSGTHDLVDVTLDGTIDLGSSTIDCSGNWDLSAVDTLDEGTSEVTLSGSSKTYNPKDQDDVHDLIITGTYTQSTGSVTYVQNSVDVQGTLTLSGGSSCRLTFQASSTFALSGTVDGTGQIIWNSDQQMPSGGTISCTTRYFDATSEVTARTYGGEVQVQYTGDNTWVFEASTHNYNGGITLSTLSGTYSLDFNTNDPTINATNVTFSDTDGTLSIDMGASTWTVSGDMNISGVNSWTEGTSSITMSGASKAITTANASNEFYDLIITGTISMGGTHYSKTKNSLDIQGTLTLNKHHMIEGSMTISGTLDGAFSLWWISTDTFPSGGTITSDVAFQVGCTISARTFGGIVNIYPKGGSNYTWIFGAGTFTFSDTIIYYGNAALEYALDFNTNNPTINVNGDVDFSDTDGTFSVDMGASTWTVSGNMDLSGIGTFDAGTSTVTMTGTARSITSGGNTLANLIINGTSISLADTISISDTLTMTAGTFDFNDQNGTIATLDSNGGSVTFGNGTIAIVDVDATGGGSFDLESATINCSGNFDIDGIGGFTANTSTLNMSGTSKTITINGEVSFYNITISGTIDIAGTAMTLEISHLLVVTGTFDLQDETLNISTNANVTIDPAGEITNNSTGIMRWLSNNTVPITGRISCITRFENGTAVISARTWHGEVRIHNAGDITYTMGAGIHIFTDFSNADAAGGTYILDCATNDANIDAVNLDFSDTDGTFTINMGDGTWSVSSTAGFAGVDTLNPNGSSLIFDGTGIQDMIATGKTFNNVTVSNSSGLVSFTNQWNTAELIIITPGANVEFQFGSTYNVTSLLRIYGDDTTDVTIASTSGGNAFNLNATASTREVGYCNLKDINNNSGSNITVSYGTNVSGNSNFDFVDAFLWDGGGGDNLASNGDNWVGDIPPTTGNPIRFDGTSIKNCTYDLAFTITNLDVIVGYSGTITQTEDLDATTNVTINDGTFTMGAGKNFTIDGNFTLQTLAIFNDAVGATWNVRGNINADNSAVTSLTNLHIIIDGSGVQDIGLSDKTIKDITNLNRTAIVTFSDGFIASGTFTSTGIGSSMKFQAGETFQIDIIDWSDCTLACTNAALVWILKNVSSNTVSGVTVSNSVASSGIKIVATSSTDNGGNLNWDFGGVVGPGLGANPGNIKEAILLNANVVGDNVIRNW